MVRTIRTLSLLVSLVGASSCAGLSGTTSEAEGETFSQRVVRQEEIIRRQKLEILRQERELEELKRQQFYNQAFKPYQKQEIDLERK